jgi:tetratricopeptide (TPR) repeat protein
MLAVIALGFFFKLPVLLALRHHPLLQPDSGLDTTAYVDLAERVLEGNVALGPGLYYVSPLYIYVLASALAIAHSFTAVRLMQLALGAIGIGLIFLTAREWFGGRAAWIAAAFAWFTGLVTFYESIILQASIDPVLTSAALLCLTFGLTGRKARWLVAAGAIFGIATLNRPNMLIGAAGVAAALLLTRRPRLSMLLVAGIAAGMAPVAVRNVVVAHQFSFVSSHGGLNFYIGNSETATGFYQQIPGISPTIGGQEKDVRRVAGQALGRPVTDTEASDYFYGLAWGWIRDHPGAAAALFVRKLVYTFNAAHVALPHSYPFYVHDERSVLRFLPVGPWILVPLGLVGLALPLIPGRRGAASRAEAPGKKTEGGRLAADARDYLVWVSFVPSYAAGVAIFFVAERYRLPLLVPLTIGAGAAVDALARGLTEDRRAMLVPGAASVILFAVFNWPIDARDGRWEEGLRLAQRLVILGRYDEADAWIPRLVPREPRPGATDYGVGLQLLGSKQPARALTHLTRAHELDPEQPSTEYALGQALLATGRAAEALPHLHRGFESGVEIPEGGYDFAVALQATGDLEGAARAVRRIRPNDRADAESWLRLGRLAMAVKAPDAAEPLFRRAVELRPDQAETHQHLGLDLLVLGRHAEAAQALGEAVRLDPRDVESLSRLAYCESELGRIDDARGHAQAALALRPDDQLARQLLAALKKR